MNKLRQLAAWAIIVCAAACFSGLAQAAQPDSMLVYIGTYTGPKSKGIYVMKLDTAAGTLSQPELAAEVTSPSFLAIHPNKRFLYAVGEVANFQGQKAGAVSALSISEGGKLTLLNQQPSGGGGPCHISVDAAGKNALVANYDGGSIACLPIADDGKLSPPSSFIQHTGSSVNPQRQKEPHAHSINFDKANRFVFAADLGLDKILVYRFDPAKGGLAPNEPAFAPVPAGGGPRHFAFHPGGKYAYTNNEMTSSVTAFTYDAERGVLGEIHTISTLPDGADARRNSTAEIQVHPSGKFLYVSNRGHDSIAMFSIDPASGKLAAIGHQPTQGKTPRNFGIDPTGTYLLAANQQTDNVVVFKIDPAAGTLKPTGSTAQVGAPVCVKFLTK